MVHRGICAAVITTALLAGPQKMKAEDRSSRDTTLFQTDQPWSARTNIGADTVLVYGIDATTADRIRSWTGHGYRAAVMTGVAWGRYAPYLRGDFDGRQHWDETQQEKDGTLRLHSGREVPYISPTEAYGRYLAAGVITALDAGAQAVYLEEPEFWADAGWSESFKRSWAEFYHAPWQPPDSSPEAQYRASKLKYFLYRRTLAQIFAAVHSYGQAHGRAIPCYVATHSLLNYAQWQIVSPEFSLLSAGADGFIGQVWTGTARAPNVYQGVLGERTFETAFLEYGALQNIARSSGKPIWYLNDPIEDNPNHSWTDYRRNWESTLTASLLQPAVARYEVLPWPNRIFDEGARYPSTEPTPAQLAPAKTRIPAAYATELQTVFRALGELARYNGAAHWEQAGSDELGILVSDTLMFQRAAPEPSDPHLGEFYGLALPLLLHGMPVEPVSIESVCEANAVADPLARYHVLMLSYEGQKPPTPAFDAALAAWVQGGGVLVVVDDDKDPYNAVSGWWNTGENHYATPRAHLFQVLGADPHAQTLQRVGKGVVLYRAQSPTALSFQTEGAATALALLQEAAGAAGLRLHGSTALVLRRGPYVVAAGVAQGVGVAQGADALASGSGSAPAPIRGDLIDLFDSNLREQQEVDLTPDTRALLLDVNFFPAGPPRVLAASARISGEHATVDSLVFQADGIEATEAVIRILATARPRQILVQGQPLAPDQYSQSHRMLLLRFRNRALPQQVVVKW